MSKRLSGSKGSISKKELNSMRSIMEDGFPDLCDIYALTERIDGIGAVVQYWTNTYRNVPCELVTKFSGKETDYGHALMAKATHAIRLPYDQTLDRTMRILHNAITYEIERVDKSSTDYTATYAILSRLDEVTTTSTPEQALPPALPDAPAATPRLGAFGDGFENSYNYD